MVAVPEERSAAPVTVVAGRSGDPAPGRRAVAVVVSPMELLRPESDLARLVERFDRVDLLVAGDDTPIGSSADTSDKEPGEDAEGTDTAADGLLEPESVELRARVTQLGLDGLHTHRLGLRTPLGSAAELDLVAALSELVGFDPDPGVYCLAPAPAPADPVRAVIDRAVQRIAQVYGVPLLRYRCLELSVVVDDAG